jgi:exosortase A-associated hydrolase 2
MDQTINIQPFYLDSPRGPLYCIYLSPAAGPPLGGVLYFHPFAEEMHKSRRMVALQARALAAQGFAVLQIDLTGCGDSAGDFGDASWGAWRSDANLALAWLQERVHSPVTLWGLRIGAMLAVEVAAEHAEIAALLLWQPVISGEQFLHQFLRIKLAGEVLAGGAVHSGTRMLREQLENKDEWVEVGGYALSSIMARELVEMSLNKLTPGCPVFWFELVEDAEDELMAPSQRLVDAWLQSGVSVEARNIVGPPFWVTQEIFTSSALLEATCEVMAGVRTPVSVN